MTTQMQIQVDKPCLRCKRPGERNAIELLPDNGVLFMVVHDDGMVCKWTEYQNMNDVAKPDRKENNPIIITCPRCKDKGRVNWYYPTHRAGKMRIHVEYYVSHEPLEGGKTWGRDKSMKQRRRCQSFTQAERDEVLKQLGRYISTPKFVQKKRKYDMKPKATNKTTKPTRRQQAILKLQIALAKQKQLELDNARLRRYEP